MKRAIVPVAGAEVVLLLVFYPGIEFDRTAQAYFGLSPRRSGFGLSARSP
jgi:hypothetical protein